MATATVENGELEAKAKVEEARLKAAADLAAAEGQMTVAEKESAKLLRGAAKELSAGGFGLRQHNYNGGMMGYEYCNIVCRNKPLGLGMARETAIVRLEKEFIDATRINVDAAKLIRCAQSILLLNGPLGDKNNAKADAGCPPWDHFKSCWSQLVERKLNEDGTETWSLIRDDAKQLYLENKDGPVKESLVKLSTYLNDYRREKELDVRTRQKEAEEKKEQSKAELSKIEKEHKQAEEEAKKAAKAVLSAADEAAKKMAQQAKEKAEARLKAEKEKRLAMQREVDIAAGEARKLERQADNLREAVEKSGRKQSEEANQGQNPLASVKGMAAQEENAAEWGKTIVEFIIGHKEPPAVLEGILMDERIIRHLNPARAAVFAKLLIDNSGDVEKCLAQLVTTMMKRSDKLAKFIKSLVK